MTNDVLKIIDNMKICLARDDFASARKLLDDLSSKDVANSSGVFNFLSLYFDAKLNGGYLTKYKKGKPKKDQKVEAIQKSIQRKNIKVDRNSSKLPISVLIICWDIGHNPLGRAYMLAEAVQRVARDVVLAGYQFERYGNEIWEPVRQSSIPVITLQGKLLPEMVHEAEKIVERYSPDLVIACKPRLPSLSLGMMFKAKKGIPLIVDVDDHELSFTRDKTSSSVSSFLENPSAYSTIVEPYESEWTQIAHNLVGFADDVIVSNVALEREFGGHQIPHVRDETAFEPKLFDLELTRKKFNIPPTSKVVMFFGTPRIHKGIGKVAEAVGNIDDKNFIFVVVGTSPDKRVTSQLESLSKGRLINIPNQPFSSIPEILSMADVVCLPQDIMHETSKYQLPAKAMDAIAMCKPLLVSRTEPLSQLVDAGVADFIEDGNLVGQIEAAAKTKITPDIQQFRRNQFLSLYSYSAAETTLRNLFANVLNLKGTIDVTTEESFWAEQKEMYPVKSEPPISIGKDIVVFWKQNDSGIYGRRHDMVAKMLSERDDVRKVILIDAPISSFDLNKKINHSNQLTQERTVYIKTFEKRLGQLDSTKLVYDVFVHKPGLYYADTPIAGRKPLIEDYCEFLSLLFYRENVNPNKATFWFYPKNYLADDLIDIFEPHSVVVDVVDDHRTWPGVSQNEIEKLTNHYSSLVSKADLAFANCQSVYDSMSQYTSNMLLVPNGCESNPTRTQYDSVFISKLREHKGPVIGFVGNLESKIDVELIERLATEIPNALVALVGSTHANPEITKLADRHNVLMPGVIQSRHVSTVIQEFTVCIVPHKRTALTANMNPLKVFVYLSNRKPVVTTDIDNLPACNALLISGDHEEFIKNVEVAISHKMPDSVYDNFIKYNSWESRFGCLDEFFNDG